MRRKICRSYRNAAEALLEDGSENCNEDRKRRSCRDAAEALLEVDARTSRSQATRKGSRGRGAGDSGAGEVEQPTDGNPRARRRRV